MRYFYPSCVATAELMKLNLADFSLMKSKSPKVMHVMATNITENTVLQAVNLQHVCSAQGCVHRLWSSYTERRLSVCFKRSEPCSRENNVQWVTRRTKDMEEYFERSTGNSKLQTILQKFLSIEFGMGGIS